MVRPLLEYCVQVWSPYKQKHIDLIEGVQKRAVRMVPGMKNLSYEQKLVKLGLTKLVERRFRGDMIETYKLITNKEGINSTKFFDPRNERGDPELNHGLKISKKRPNRDMRKYTFSQRVVNPWNMLQREEVQAKKTSSFKAKFDANEAERRIRRRDRGGNSTLFKRLYRVDGIE